MLAVVAVLELNKRMSSVVSWISDIITRLGWIFRNIYRFYRSEGDEYFVQS